MTKISYVKSGIFFFLFFHWLAGPRSHLSGTDYLLATLVFQEFKTSNSTRNFKADNRVIRKCLGHHSTFSDLHYEPWIFNFGFARFQISPHVFQEISGWILPEVNQTLIGTQVMPRSHSFKIACQRCNSLPQT